MNIGFNILYLSPGEVGGTETYAVELINNMTKLINTKDKLFVFTSVEGKVLFQNNPGINCIVLPIKSKNRVLRILSENVMLPFYCLKYQINIMHSLGYTCPLWNFVTQVVTILDLNFHYCPQDFQTFERLMLNILVRMSAQRASHIITISDASKESLLKVLRISEDKVTRIYLGTKNQSAVNHSKTLHQPLRILTVSASYPHKNLLTVAKVVEEFIRSSIPVRWDVCGLRGSDHMKIVRFIKEKRLTKYIKLHGYISAKKLESMYRNTDIFVFPSAYEGFGLPVLEAMSRNIPVISSSAFALKEVVGSGGLLVPPYDVKGYIIALRSLLDDKKLRREIILRGKRNLKRFDWKDTARHTYLKYQSLTGGKQA